MKRRSEERWRSRREREREREREGGGGGGGEREGGRERVDPGSTDCQLSLVNKMTCS
jgi:hypothetical protein